MKRKIGLRIMRRIVYTDGQPGQFVLTELGDGEVIISFHDDTGSDDVVGAQKIAVVADRRQTITDALALLHRIGEK
jgi:hypothetical protein